MAAVREDLPEPARASAANRRTPVFIVASPRPQVGKTFLARLLVDYLRLDGGEAIAFDLEPSGDGLRDYVPRPDSVTDLGDIKDQMALFDCLIVDDGIGKVIDLGCPWFERFFAIIEQIGFIEEASHRSIEPTILFAADPHPVSMRAYANLRRRFPHGLLVPVFNETIVKGHKLRDQFPFGRAAAVPLQIPALAPLLKTQMGRFGYSLTELHDEMPMAIPVGLAFELRSWTRRTFLEFRELELRRLLEKLRAALPGVEL